KIAAFVAGFIAVPVLILLLLSKLHVVPLEVTRMDSQGHAVKQSVFSSSGMSGLKDILLGRKNTSPPERPKAGGGKVAASGSSVPSATQPAKGHPTVAPEDKKPVSPELRTLYAENEKKDMAPPPLHGPAQAPQGPESGGGPAGEELKRVVDQTQPAFQF